MFEQLPSTDPLGTDFALDSNGDVQVTMSGSIETVCHQDNVAQAIRVNLMTNPHSYLWGDFVGTRLAEYVDQPLTESLKRSVQAIIFGAVESDPRIQAVQDVRIEQSFPDSLVITIQALVSTIGEVEIPISIRR
jgi:phage baseplate assembly protein W